MAARPSGHAMLRFAVDPNAGVLLTVSAESPAGTLDIQFAAFHSMSARIALNAVVRAAPLRYAIDNGFDSALLRRALVFSFAHHEKRDCAACGSTCTCAPSFPAPAHSLDFSAFGACMARALGNYSGSGEQQLAVHRGPSPLCVKNMFVRLAVRHLDDPLAVERLWIWAVQSRYANLPTFPARVHMPRAIKEPPSQSCIVAELDALWDEEERCNSFSAASAASAGSADIGVDPVTAAGVQYPSISPEDLAAASPAKSQSLRLPPHFRLNFRLNFPRNFPRNFHRNFHHNFRRSTHHNCLGRSQCINRPPIRTQGSSSRRLPPPRPQPPVVHRLFPNNTAFQPPMSMCQSVAVKPEVDESQRVLQQASDQVEPLVRQVSVPQGLVLPQGQSVPRSFPVSQRRSQLQPLSIVDEYSQRARPEPEKLSSPTPRCLSSTSQNSNIPSTAQAFGSLVPDPTGVSSRGVQGALLTPEQRLGVGVTQPNPRYGSAKTIYKGTAFGCGVGCKHQHRSRRVIRQSCNANCAAGAHSVAQR